MVPSYLCCDGDQMNNGNNSGLNLNALSVMACYDLPLLQSSAAAIWIPTGPPPAEEGGHSKRLRRTESVPESNGSGNSVWVSGGGSGFRRNNSAPSLTTVQFRNQVLTCIQRFSVPEAAEEDAKAEEDGVAGGDGTRLVLLLISCAEAVACRDKAHASALLSELRASALVFGSAFQRVASCFVQGLADRLAMVQPLGTVGSLAPAMNERDIDWEKQQEALRLVYDICPHIQFGHFVANNAILEAFEGENFVHVVDLGMTRGLPHGHQWRNLIQSLAARSGSPPGRLRITAVGSYAKRFQLIGNELEAYAESVGINLEFSVVESSLDSLKKEEIETFEDEVVVVNSILELHCVVKESRGALNSVLQIIHELSPRVLVLVEQDSSHNGPFFLGRFMEALHYYSAIFDSLDAMLPRFDTRRAKMEQFFFAEEIKNIVSCEGPARVERHERVDQWRRRMSRAGFQPAPIKMAAQAKLWLGKMMMMSSCEGFTIVEEKGCLVLGWKSKPIVAASCWKC
ncbi:GRAS family protein RAD1-like [Diospyros lotus]|uniref:GRAS family protein RAD1-like n=1 Tax=Diospyros lotus TaxID=55363 RepID=UPI00225146D8|nr:GRAS family protein RAD1-like [Diospyros lotus]